MARTQLYLVRHGEQDPASGHARDGGLSQLGREQANLLGRRLRTVPFPALHHSPMARAAQTADIIAGHLPQVPRHACDFIADRTPVPSTGQRDRYPGQWLAWLDGVPDDERDEDAAALQVAVEHFGVTGDNDRYELLITHNFVIGWFVRHMLDAPVWRWIGLNQANCAITIVQWDSDRPPTLVSFNDTGHLQLYGILGRSGRLQWEGLPSVCISNVCYAHGPDDLAVPVVQDVAALLRAEGLDEEKPAAALGV